MLLCSASLALAKDCPPQGDSKIKNVQALDVQKNRSSKPPGVDAKITLAAMLVAGDDTKRWTIGQAATITGYVADVLRGGPESCHCHKSGANDEDRHIIVVSDPKDYANNRAHVIVEVTPQFYAAHPDWATSLKAQLLHKQVSFTGWLFFDEEHKQNSVNTNPSNAKDWRATAWEIHPVTSITITK